MTSIAAIIPTTGRPELSRAVASVLSQTVPVEPVVVLDRPQNLSAVAKSLEGLPHTLIVTPGGIGGASSRNLGATSSASDVVAFLDDDDAWLPEKTSMQLAELKAHPASVVTCLANLRGDRVRVVPERVFDGSTSLSTYLLDRSTIRLRRNFMQSSTLLMERTTWEENRWTDGLSRHQDWDLLIRLDRSGNAVKTINRPLVDVYQGSSNSISQSNAWRVSQTWLENVAPDASARSRSDFLASVVLRGAIASRDWEAVPRLISSALRGRPHLSALIVAASALRPVR